MFNFERTPRTITCNGADGAGKTTIADAVHEILATSDPGSVLMRGMGYHVWDNRQFVNIADDMMASWADQNDPDELVVFPNGETLGLEDAKAATFRYIGQRCYTRSRELKESEGVFTVIDSDPYLKGLMWANIFKNESSKNKWHTVVTASSPFPEVVFNIIIPDALHDAASTAFSRIIMRDGGVSKYDPQSVDDARERIEAAELALQQVLLTGVSTSVIAILNEQVDDLSVLSQNTKSIALRALYAAAQA